MLLTNSTHPFQSLNGLASLRAEKKLCDVVIETDDGVQFNAHKALLASCSPYFRAMFCGEMEESKKQTIRIRDIPSPTMAAILDYCYTASLEIDEESVQYILPAASLLQLSWVREVCCEYMKSQLSSTNCLGIRAFADTHHCKELCETADTFAQQHYLEVLEGEEFLELDSEHLIELLQSEELNVHSEEQVYESLMTWIKHDVTNRLRHLPSALKHVRLPLVDRNYLVSKISPEPLIRQNVASRDLVDEAKDYLLLPEQRAHLSGPRTRPRKPMKSNEVLFAVGGWCNGDAINMVEHYNVLTDEWKQVANMNKKRCGVGVAVLNNFIYAIGGHDGNSYLNSVERYDPRTDYWSSNVAPTSVCRTSVGVAVLNGQIYAVGGQDGISCLNVVERYELLYINTCTCICAVGSCFGIHNTKSYLLCFTSPLPLAMIR